MKEKNLTVIEHIDEIRKRLMVIVVFFVIAVIGSFFIAKPIIKFLQSEAGYEEFHAFNVVDPIALYLKVIVFLAVVIISPIIMYQFWSFISPGLHETERKVTLSYIPFAFLLMLTGNHVFLFRPRAVRYEFHEGAVGGIRHHADGRH